MRVLGVDPGSIVTGWGVVEARGNSLVLVDAGAITPRASLPFEKRLALIHEQLAAAIERCRPEAAAIESLFFAKNVRSAIQLGHARGVALLAIARASLPLAEYAPMEVKRAVTGAGKAEKEQVAHMVRLMLGIHGGAVREKLDVSDALAIAICHAHTSATAARLARAR